MPHRAELAVGAVVVVLVLAIDLRGAIGVLVVRRARLLRGGERGGVHADARSAGAGHAGSPSLGPSGALVLVVTLPLSAVVAGLAVFAVGVAGRLAFARREAASPSAGHP